MKTYSAKDFGSRVVITEAGWRNRHLRPRLDLANHSPTGFAWGYEGSGPAQLALALLADVLGDDDRALRLHQRFKRRLVASLPQSEPLYVTDDDVRRIVREIEAEQAAA